ncbi:MAG: Asp23/Gls24 family envelope stress response protein [Clostridia bacterium]
MATDLKPQVITRYSSIIASIANSAITKTEGLSLELGLVKYKFGLSTLKDRNVMVYIDGENVIIDMYVNVAFGYSVPEVVCQLQEKIKREVEESTRFIISKINVHVANVSFN